MRKNLIIIILGIILVLPSCSKEKRSNKAGIKMQDFIVDISFYARSFDSDFIIVPQNGVELLFKDLDTEGPIDDRVNAAISGIGNEGLFYEGAYNPDFYRIDALVTFRAAKPVLSSEYVDNDANVNQAYSENISRLFVPFVRTANNYDYLYIPDTIIDENANNVKNLGQVKNYLYIISSGGFTSKDEYLNAIRQTNYDAVIIDLFYDDTELTAAEVNSLKVKANGATRVVLSYISIGSAENYRYYFKDNWKKGKPNWLKKKYEGYEDEYWVKFWKDDWRDIIFGNDESYMKKILNAEFDGAYLDNVEAYYFLYYND